ncbi:choice-of-anchor L domain-containing protein [Winogradskyella sp.]
MDYIKHSLRLLLCLFCCATYAQQITVDNSISPQDLIENTLIQGCVEVSNITSSYNGSAIGIGSFGYFDSAASNFPFQNGIVLSTGDASAAGNGLTNLILNDGDDSWVTDPDIEQALGITGTLNATSIEFNFVSISNQIQFSYILASEEYFGNFPCNYSDGFAFLIREAGTADPYTNIAVIPGTSTPVNTNTIHDEIVGFCPASNAQYFEGNNIGDTNYNGRTTVLTATAAIQPNVEYQIKLVIADQTDENYDSAVFIEGNSFNATVDLGEDFSMCASQFTLDGNIQNPGATYSWYYNNTLIPGANLATYDANQSGNYRVVIDIPLLGTTCTIEDDINITLNSTQTTDPISDFELCDDISNDGIETFDLSVKDSEVIASVMPSNYTITYHLSLSDAENDMNSINGPIQNTSNPQTVYARIEDTTNGCLAYAPINLVVHALPVINDPNPLLVCDDQNADGFTSIDLTQQNEEIIGLQTGLDITYHTSETDAASGANPLPMPYVNTNANETVYISVRNQQTGCISTTSLDITVLDNPVIDTGNHYIDACDADHDGWASFDLTTIIADVLQGITDVTVTFHESNTEALNNENPIADDTNYNNIVAQEQIVFIRVESNTTGCAAVTPIELHTNLLLTATNINDIIVCDEDNDGSQEFNFESIAGTIYHELENITITFYETEAERDSQINPIDPSSPYDSTSNPQIIYITLESPTCFDVAEFQLILNPTVEFDPIDMQQVCDSDQDGFTSTNLSIFNDAVTNGENGYAVGYFLTEADASSNSNQLPNNYTNTTNPYTLYTRITSVSTGCSSTSSIEIEVLPAPESSAPTGIIICDADMDGLSIIDLQAKINEVVTSTVDRTITFHLSNSDAINGQNAIVDINAYEASTQSIYIRIENDLTGCHSVEILDVIVNTLPYVGDLSNYVDEYIVCEDETDGIGEFIFETKDAEALDGQTGKTVSYYLTETDAINGVNAIDKTSTYQNISNPQTIYVRIENNTDADCFTTSSFEIEVGTNPNYNQPTNWFICDDISNDGIAEFDLSTKVTEISAGIPETQSVTFYLTEDDARTSTNPLPLQFSNTVNPQEIYVQIDNGTICNSITSFVLNVIQIPDVNTLDQLVQCDVDYDGLVNWDLTVAEIEILDVRQENTEVSYYETVEDLEAGINAIADPENFTNISNPQTVYVKVHNTVSDCFANIPVDLVVNVPPAINTFGTYEICDNPNSEFNLNDIDTVIVDNSNNVLLSYHTSYSDAETNSNALAASYTYNSNNDNIFARIEDATSGCFYVYEFTLQINPLPVANQPNNMQACDDESNNGIETFDLESQTLTVLGSQNSTDYTVTYHLNEQQANNDTNPLASSFSASTNTEITVRIENNETGCYSLTSFFLIVNPFPNTPQPIFECDSNYDGITVFDLTTTENDLFQSDATNEVITYFESITDLESDTNPITNPESYTNLSNPQTVYIRVTNTVGNCSRYVPLELNAYLPPVVNDIQIFDACENDNGSVDLTSINNVLVDTDYNVLFSYYTTQNDALLNQNVLDTNYLYTSTIETLYARVEFSTTHCFFVYPFTLRINPLPVANQPNDLIACDDDYDGQVEFNLNQQNQNILNGQSATLFSISYHNTQEEADNGEFPLAQNYVAYDGETIFARVVNNSTGCHNTTQFSVVVNPLPFLDIEDQVICLDHGPLLVSANTNIISDQYLWSTGETTPEIEITDVGSYWVSVTTEFGCEVSQNFEVSESEAATIEATEIIDFSDPNNITVTISGIGNYLYQLDNGEPQESNVFENVAMGYHTVRIIDLNGCSEVTREVLVIDIPKHLSPNGDGQFDTWHIVGVETLPGTIIHIFDRYGKHLTTLKHDTQGWDGTFNGFKLPASDYWFTALVQRGTQSFEVKGHFALRR